MRLLCLLAALCVIPSLAETKGGTAPKDAKVKTEPKAEAAPPPPNASEAINFRLIEVFNAEQLPGSGTLTFKTGDKTEEIKLGSETGYYGLGVIFDGSQLPEQYGKSFRKNQVIQVALGTVRSRLQGQVPQFGVVSIVTDGIPKSKATYPFYAPAREGDKAPAESAFLLFTSPNTLTDRTDEEKLKGTYFAQKGKLKIASPLKPQNMEVKSQGKRLSFRLRMMKFDFDATLVTPFNAQPASLKGKIEFPVYSAKGKESEQLLQKFVAESVDSAAAQAMQDGVSQHNRGVAGSTPGPGRGGGK